MTIYTSSAIVLLALSSIVSAQTGNGYINVAIGQTENYTGCLADNGQWADGVIVPCGVFTAGSPSTSYGQCLWSDSTFACPGLPGGADITFAVGKSLT